ncbi:MAG: MarR family winged helix-turn-helix transcriptional regulator [Gemmatimonadota bacterium]
MFNLDDLYTHPGHLIRRVHQIAVALFMAECGESGITPVQYACLKALKANPGVDATRLSALIAFDRSTIGNVLERLERKGLIQRFPSADDKRIKLLKLVPQGRLLLRRLETAVARSQKKILAPLSAEQQRTLMKLLTQLVVANGEALPPTSGSGPKQD